MICKICGHSNAPIKRTCEKCYNFLEGYCINNTTGKTGYRHSDGSFTPDLQQIKMSEKNIVELIKGMEMKNYQDIFKDHNLPFGRLISNSKSNYMKQYPKHDVVFNARIYLKEYYEREKSGKIADFFAGMEDEIWYGDLDLTLDTKKLSNIVKKNKLDIVITTEYGKYITEIIQ